MPDVKYVDEKGYAWAKRVKDLTVATNFKRGITIGPPSLTALGLTPDEHKQLQNALVDAWLIDAETVRGNAGKLYNVVKNTLPEHETSDMVRQIKAIYQKVMLGG